MSVATASPIHLSAPDIGELERSYVSRAISSGWVAPVGPDLDAFEQEVAARVGVRSGVALNSGTSALHVALLAWNVGEGDFVPTSTLTFVATANAIAYTGATPVFVDVDPATGNINPATLERAIIDLRSNGRRVPAIVPVDVLGKCPDHEAIGAIATDHGVKVLSDSAQALGSARDGTAAGAFGDAAAVSFNGNKIVTTSGGGMLLTNDDVMADRVRFLATQARVSGPGYEHLEIGYNYRLSNVLAALGRAQLTRLDEMMGRRREIRSMYAELFSDVSGVSILGSADDALDNCWLTAILVDDSLCGWTPIDLLNWLAKHGIESRRLWKPLHLQPAHRLCPAFIDGSAERLFNDALALPSGSILGPGDVERLRHAIGQFLEGAR